MAPLKAVASVATGGAMSGVMQLFSALWQLMKASKDNQFIQLAVLGGITGAAYKVQQMARM